MSLRSKCGARATREVCGKLEAKGIIGGFDLGRIEPKFADRLLIAVTEKHTRAELDQLISEFKAL